jgi:hypothetical protein
MPKGCCPDLEYGDAIRVRGSILRELHALLKEKDPSFGGLEKVQTSAASFCGYIPNL